MGNLSGIVVAAPVEVTGCPALSADDVKGAPVLPEVNTDRPNGIATAALELDSSGPAAVAPAAAEHAQQAPETGQQAAPSANAAAADGVPRGDSERELQQLEQAYVHDVYNAIAPHFSATRFAVWPKVRSYLPGLALVCCGPAGNAVCDCHFAYHQYATP